MVWIFKENPRNLSPPTVQYFYYSKNSIHRHIPESKDEYSTDKSYYSTSKTLHSFTHGWPPRNHMRVTVIYSSTDNVRFLGRMFSKISWQSLQISNLYFPVSLTLNRLGTMWWRVMRFNSKHLGHTAVIVFPISYLIEIFCILAILPLHHKIPFTHAVSL